MNSYKSFLMKGTKSGSSVTWEKLIDIKDFPDLFPVPEALEKTTLSDRARTYEEGIEESESMEFTANYSLDDFNTLRALKGQELQFAVWFGGTEDADGVPTPTGTDGKFKFAGYLSAGIVGKGVNEIQEIKITIAPTKPIAVDSASA